MKIRILISITTFLGVLTLLVSCNQQETSKKTESVATKKLNEFSGKELYEEMQSRNKFNGEKKIVDTPPPIIVNPQLSSYSNKELYEALLVIYGNDNRKNPYDKSITDTVMLRNYKKVACLINASQLQLQRDGNYKLNPSRVYTTIGGRNLCNEENFYGEPVASFCTGFAVSKTMFATAGHCLNKENLKDKLFIYGFMMKSR
ncbi:hypothetical protein, partial [Ferruginibacter sp.]